MKLAYDFTSAVKPEPSGTARYALELLRAILPKLAPEDRVTLGYRLSRWGRRRFAPRFDDPRVQVRPLQSPLAFLTYGKPDVFHGLGVNIPLGLPGSTRRFVTIHGFVLENDVEESRREARARRLEKIRTMIARADRVFVVSKHERDRTAELCGCSPAKFCPVYHGVDHVKYRPDGDAARDRAIVRARLDSVKGAVAGRPYLLYLGAVTHVKNTPMLLRAFAESRARRDADLVLAGQIRSESVEILTHVKELGLESSVHAIGHVAPDEVPSWIRQARGLVHPSKYESFGLPIVEAMACGTPVACSDTAAMPEIAGGAALLFSPESSESIAKALDILVEDEAARAQLTERGLRRAREFTWERAADATLATYREVLAGAPLSGEPSSKGAHA